MEKKRSIQSLKQGENVVFKVNPYGDREDTFDGHVIYVDDEHKIVCVSYMYGYKSLSDDIPYSKMLAVYDEEGEYQRFDNVHGTGFLLVDEEELKKQQEEEARKVNEIVEECTISGVLEEAEKFVPRSRWGEFLDACVRRGDS